MWSRTSCRSWLRCECEEEPLTATTLQIILPEIILLVTAGVVLTLELAQRRRTANRTLAGISIIGFLAAALATYTLRGADPQPVTIMMAFDGFALFLRVLVLIGMILVVLVSMDYVQQRTRFKGEYYALVLCAGLAISAAVGANDLLMVYLAMEFLSITSYVLVGFLRGDIRSNEGAIKYFLYGAVASAVMLYGISLLYGATGSTNLNALNQALRGDFPAQELVYLGYASVALIVVGFGFKASLVPFHQWVPDTYEGAPTPITGFLSTASKAAGFALMTRTLLVGLNTFSRDWLTILAGISIITMTFGNLVALRQTNMKRLLAYSSIAQAGYILIGLVSVPQSDLVILPFSNLPINGVNSLLIYLFGYLFTNLGAFAVVIAIENQTGKVELKEYGGLIYRSPWLTALMLIFMLSLAGIPPTLGFWGKYFVFGAAVQIQFYALALAGLVNAVIAAGYYLNVVRYMFLMSAEDDEPIKVTPALNLGLALMLVVVLLVGIFPSGLIRWASESVQFLTQL